MHFSISALNLLHNSSTVTVPRAASYRARFEKQLLAIFHSMHEAYAALESRMGIETMKEAVTKVLHIWQAWSLFPLSLTAKLYLGWFLLINVLFVDGTVDEALTPADGQVLDRSGGPPEM